MNVDSVREDPVVPDWQAIQLADTWPDSVRVFGFSGWKFFKSIFGKHSSVELSEDLPGKSKLPRYVLQEFHNLPNGNFSNRISRGYITGFERAMLGTLDHARQWLAYRLKDCDSVLDVGTAGGKTARAVQESGVTTVWGLDPSPYLLKHAASDHPGINFVQGIAEDLPFPNERFDGISVCFVFHEIPPKFIRAALREFHRVLKPGGRVTISEPSESQLRAIRWRELLTIAGWRRMYFKLLANSLYEPFVAAWHRQDKPGLFSECGFELAEFQPGMPINLYLLRKPA